MKSRQKVCIIIPAYNEGAVVCDVLKQLQDRVSKSGYDITILVINDGSSDSTSAEAKKSGAVVIDHILNTGAGGATATGLLYAHKNNFDVALTMDADGQHLPEDAIRGVAELAKQNVDLLIGSRLVDTEGMSKVKVVGNQGLSAITWILFGVKSTDSQSGLRIFSKKALAELRWKATGYEFCSEMLWRAKQAGLTIGEYPIKAVYTDYSKSKGQSNWNAVNIIKNMTKSRFMEFFR